VGIFAQVILDLRKLLAPYLVVFEEVACVQVPVGDSVRTSGQMTTETYLGVVLALGHMTATFFAMIFGAFSVNHV